jgi:hypothetical protein
VPTPQRSRGYALVMVFFFGSVGLLVLGSVLSWATSQHNNVQRNNAYYDTLAAAEAASEKVVSIMADDYQKYGDAVLLSRLDTYRSLVPTPSEDSFWENFEFNNGVGDTGATSLEQSGPFGYRVLGSQYRGLFGYATTYRITSNARLLNMPFTLTAGVQQSLEVSTIPLFQFAIFYNMDLEICPGALMMIGGPVHCNATNYNEPNGVTLTFLNDVTAVGPILSHKKPGDPSTRSSGSIVFRGEKDGYVSSLTVPIGTNNTPDAVREIIEIPPSSESPSSEMGQQRYYNKADLVILLKDSYNCPNSADVTISNVLTSQAVMMVVTNTTNLTAFGTNYPPYTNLPLFLTVVTVKPSISTTTPTNTPFPWLRTDTNIWFFNKRENKTVKTAQIDLGNFIQNAAISNSYVGAGGPSNRPVDLIYIADLRTNPSAYEAGIRLTNGMTLPSAGLTLATPNPLYVLGHYNATTSILGTSNTAPTKPASLVADAITILSTAWRDANAGADLGSRVASNTTVNAAFLSGIVPTVPGSYSGGVENFPRFLESWSSKTFTYNGSMVVMYPCKYATGLWLGTGTAYGIYNPPTRNWYFDLNFRDPAKMPPGTPQVRAVVRGTWTTVRPNTTTPSPFH